MKHITRTLLVIFTILAANSGSAFASLSEAEQATADKSLKSIKYFAHLMYKQSSDKEYKEGRVNAKKANAKLLGLYATHKTPDIAYAISYYYTYQWNHILALKYAELALKKKNILSKSTYDSLALIVAWAKKRMEQEKPKPQTQTINRGGSVIAQGGQVAESPPRPERLN